MPLLVDENSRLSKALSLHPDVLDYIVSLNPHDFQRLHNPLMRRLMPPRISLKRVAKITNRPVVDILARIHEIAGQPLSEEDWKEIAARAGLTAPDDEAPFGSRRSGRARSLKKSSTCLPPTSVWTPTLWSRSSRHSGGVVRGSSF